MLPALMPARSPPGKTFKLVGEVVDFNEIVLAEGQERCVEPAI
jgi:hypothetical protein